MDEEIIIYGASDEEQFSSPRALIDYLSRTLFRINEGRFRYTQCKNADIIVISRKGLAYGHLIVEERVNSTNEDCEAFPPAKCTYLINSSAVYENPVRLFADLGIRVVAFGTYITQDQFVEIQNRAGRITTHT
jgi:hypothetical protein